MIRTEFARRVFFWGSEASAERLIEMLRPLNIPVTALVRGDVETLPAPEKGDRPGTPSEHHPSHGPAGSRSQTGGEGRTAAELDLPGGHAASGSKTREMRGAPAESAPRHGRVLKIDGQIGRFRIAMTDAQDRRTDCAAGLILVDGVSPGSDRSRVAMTDAQDRRTDCAAGLILLDGVSPNSDRSRIARTDAQDRRTDCKAGGIPLDGITPASIGPAAAEPVPAGNLLTLAELEALAQSPEQDGAALSLAVWLDPGEGFPDRTLSQRVFRALSVLARRKACALVVLCRHVPLYGMEGQEIYDDLRKAGVRFFRAGAQPAEIQTGEGLLTLAVEDLTLPGPPVKLLVDRLLVIEQPHPPRQAAEVAALLGEPLDAGGFLQKDNPHLYPHRALRKGVFYVGSCRGEHAHEEFTREIQAVLAEFGEPLRSGFLATREKIDIDKGRCVSCLTCVRVCPHHALEIGPGSVPLPAQAACQECGLCAALCPGTAIRLLSLTALPPAAGTEDAAVPAVPEPVLGSGEGPGPARPSPPVCEGPDRQSVPKVRDAADRRRPDRQGDQKKPVTVESASTSPRPARPASPEAVVFACARWAVPAGERVEKLGLTLPATVGIVSIPCACSLSEEMLLDALAAGAERILVLGCHQDNCLSQKGTAAGRRRLLRVAEVLRAAGRDPESCLQFVSAAPNEIHRGLGLIRAWTGALDRKQTDGSAGVHKGPETSVPPSPLPTA